MRGATVSKPEIDRSDRSAVLMTLLASLLYGSQYVVIKVGIGGTAPLFFGAMTMGIGGLLALLLVMSRQKIDLSIFKHPVVWAGMIAATSMIACQYIGLTLSSASIGGLIVGSNVIFVAPLSALLFKEKIGWKGALGVVLGLFGLFTITTGWDVSTLTTGVFAGYLLLLGASFSIAATYPLTKLAARHMGYAEWVMSFHILSSLALFGLSVLGSSVGIAPDTSIPALLYVGLLCTAVPTMLWAKGLQSITLTTSATILLSESVFAVILGAVVLSEPLGPITLLGAAMVFTAIFIAADSGRSKKGRANDR